MGSKSDMTETCGFGLESHNKKEMDFNDLSSLFCIPRCNSDCCEPVNPWHFDLPLSVHQDPSKPISVEDIGAVGQEVHAQKGGAREVSSHGWRFP